MAKTKVTGHARIMKKDVRTNKHTYPVQSKDEKKVNLVYHSGQKVTTSPEGVKTFAEAIDKVMRNYSGAWERLAKK